MRERWTPQEDRHEQTVWSGGRRGSFRRTGLLAPGHHLRAEARPRAQGPPSAALDTSGSRAGAPARRANQRQREEVLGGGVPAAHALKQTFVHQAAERLVHPEHGGEHSYGRESQVMPLVDVQDGQVLIATCGESGHGLSVVNACSLLHVYPVQRSSIVCRVGRLDRRRAYGGQLHPKSGSLNRPAPANSVCDSHKVHCRRVHVVMPRSPWATPVAAPESDCAWADSHSHTGRGQRRASC